MCLTYQVTYLPLKNYIYIHKTIIIPIGEIILKHINNSIDNPIAFSKIPIRTIISIEENYFLEKLIQTGSCIYVIKIAN